MTGDATSAADVRSTLRSRSFLVLLVLAAGIGLVVSLAAWGFLELVHQIQQGVYTDLPRDLGYHHGAPVWWPLPVLGIAGLVTAAAIVFLPGRGGHVPAEGLHAGAANPIELPGILVAAIATIGLGVVLGPEAPLIALGSGLAVLMVRLTRRPAPPQALAVIAASGSFAALSFIFDSPIIAAVILIEAAGVGGASLPLLLVPGLLAAGIGSLVSVGMGSWTGLSTSAYSLGALPLPAFARPSISEVAWTIPLAIAAAVMTFGIFLIARTVVRVVTERPLLLTPIAGLAVAGLAIAFSQTSDKDIDQVLFSGQDQLGPLIAGAGTWSLSALALVIVFKSIAWSISLGAFRGGPTFPALFLGGAGGVLASHLPGFGMTPAVAVGMAAMTASVLKLPLSATVLAVVLTAKSGLGASPLIVVGVVVAYLTSLRLPWPERAPAARGDDAEEAGERFHRAAGATPGARA